MKHSETIGVSTDFVEKHWREFSSPAPFFSISLEPLKQYAKSFFKAFVGCQAYSYLFSTRDTDVALSVVKIQARCFKRKFKETTKQEKSL